MLVAVLLALGSAIVYGAGDFCGGLAARRNPLSAVVLGSQLAGLLVLLPAVALLGGRPDAASLLWGALAGLSAALGGALFYAALARGTMSVIAPVTAVTAAVVPVIVGLLLGERPGPLALVGVVVAVAAIVIVSAEGGVVPAPAVLLRDRSAQLSLVAGAAFGLLFVLLSRASDASGLWPLVGARCASIPAVLLVVLLRRRPLLPNRAGAPLVIAAGIADIAGAVLFLLASREGLLVLTSVLTSLYPAVTVLLAQVALRERLVRLQLGGMVLAGTAVALITLA